MEFLLALTALRILEVSSVHLVDECIPTVKNTLKKANR